MVVRCKFIVKSWFCNQRKRGTLSTAKARATRVGERICLIFGGVGGVVHKLFTGQFLSLAGTAPTIKTLAGSGKTKAQKIK